jgi:hypothetical protein
VLVGGAIALGCLGLGATMLPDFMTQRILLFQVNDDSASANVFAALRRELCQVSSQNLKYNDAVVWMSFADSTEVTRDLTLGNSLALLGQCQQITASSSIGKVAGTSFVRAVDRTQRAIAKKRNEGNTNPVVASFTLQAAEPGPGQPELNWQHIHTQLQKITSDRGVVVIIGPTGELQEDLETNLQDIPRVHICPVANGKTCLESAITTARKL